jgi:uncharacterized membrane protein YccC
VKKKSNSERWAVIRIPRELYERILAGQGSTQHETISRAMDAREDPKCARRLRELRAELGRTKEELADAQRNRDMLAIELKGAMSTLADRSASARTIPMFSQLNGAPHAGTDRGLPVFGKGKR